MSKQNYSDKEKAEALAIYDTLGGNLTQTAKKTGVPKSTLKEWRDGRINSDCAEIRTEKKAQLADLFENLAYSLIESVDESTITQMHGQQRITSAGIAVDKMRLLREQPTNINANTQTPEQLAKKYREYLINEGIAPERAEEIMREEYPEVQQLDSVN